MERDGREGAEERLPGAGEFAAEARRFCAFVRCADELPLDLRLREARRRMAALYRAALDLPDPAALDVDDSDAPDVEGGRVEPSFGKADVYWLVPDPTEEQAPTVSLLSDDFGDTYLDVARGLQLWDRGKLDDAVWEWRFNFDAHWGRHAVDALRALHYATERG